MIDDAAAPDRNAFGPSLTPEILAAGRAHITWKNLPTFAKKAEQGRALPKSITNQNDPAVSQLLALALEIRGESRGDLKEERPAATY